MGSRGEPLTCCLVWRGCSFRMLFCLWVPLYLPTPLQKPVVTQQDGTIASLLAGVTGRNVPMAGAAASDQGRRPGATRGLVGSLSVMALFGVETGEV